MLNIIHLLDYLEAAQFERARDSEWERTHQVLKPTRIIWDSRILTVSGLRVLSTLHITLCAKMIMLLMARSIPREGIIYACRLYGSNLHVRI